MSMRILCVYDVSISISFSLFTCRVYGGCINMMCEIKNECAGVPDVCMRRKKKHQHISTFSLFYSFTRGRAISISPSDFETNPHLIPIYRTCQTYTDANNMNDIHTNNKRIPRSNESVIIYDEREHAGNGHHSRHSARWRPCEREVYCGKYWRTNVIQDEKQNP